MRDRRLVTGSTVVSVTKNSPMHRNRTLSREDIYGVTIALRDSVEAAKLYLSYLD